MHPMNQPFDITTLSQNNELQLDQGLVFASMDDVKTYFRAYAKQQPFDIVVRSSNNGVNTKGKLALACLRQLQYLNTRKNKLMGDHDEAATSDDAESVTATMTATTAATAATATKEKLQRNSYSNRDNCPFQIRLYRPKGSVLWTVTSIKDEYNHDMAAAFITFARHRRLNPEQTRLALNLIGAGCKNQAIVDTMRTNFPGCEVIAKDIGNMRRRFMGTSSEEKSRLYQFISKLSATMATMCNIWSTRRTNWRRFSSRTTNVLLGLAGFWKSLSSMQPTRPTNTSSPTSTLLVSATSVEKPNLLRRSWWLVPGCLLNRRHHSLGLWNSSKHWYILLARNGNRR
jgi:hypothetical protein